MECKTIMLSLRLKINSLKLGQLVFRKNSLMIQLKKKQLYKTD